MVTKYLAQHNFFLIKPMKQEQNVFLRMEAKKSPV